MLSSFAVATLLLSHNLQVFDPSVPALNAQQFGSLLAEEMADQATVEVLQHPHWRLLVTGVQSAAELGAIVARSLLQGRRKLEQGHAHTVLALGGRKDSPASPGSPLQEGSWGVDVVETTDAAGFVKAISWEALKGSRPTDGVFEISVDL